MIRILKHIQLGLNTAAGSFLTLWKHKKLLLYLIPAVLLNFTLGLYSAYDFVYALISRGAPTDFILVIKAMSKAIIADLGIACLSIHTFMLLEHQVASARDTLRAVMARIPHIAAWSIISGTVIYVALSILHLISGFLTSMPILVHVIMGIQIMLGIIWILIVFFMIQILALENLSIIESLQLSYKLSRHVILEIIGGEFWIGLIWLLSALPIMIIFEKPMAYYLFNDQAIREWSGIAQYGLILIGWICASAQTVFRTRLYYSYYIQPRDQETNSFFYPQF